MLAFVHLILDDLHGTALTLDPEALSPPLLKRVIAKRDQFDHGIRAIIQQGIDQGVFKPGDPKMIEFAMMGAVNWIAKWFDPSGRDDVRPDRRCVRGLPGRRLAHVPRVSATSGPERPPVA